MTYARAHDQTVADDYYTAMASVEESLDFLCHEEGDITRPLNEDERARILVFADMLARPELEYLERLAVVTQIKRVLTGEEVNEIKVEQLSSACFQCSQHEAMSPSRL